MSTFRIQEFARLGGVTVRTLHHYDRPSSDPRVKKASPSPSSHLGKIVIRTQSA